jgi:hypothetical protein
MAQRFTAIMAGIAAAACVAVGLLMWQLLQNSRSVHAATLAEMRDFNARLLAQLAEKPAERTAESVNWAPVRVKLVSAVDESAVAGGKVSLYGGPFGSGAESSISESGASNAEGIVELHSVPFGRYTLHVQAPGDGFRASKPVLVGPDRDEPIAIRVPSIPGTIRPRFKSGMPESAEGLAFLIDVWVQPLTVDGLMWEYTSGRRTFLVDGASVTMVAQRFRESAGTAGFDLVHFDVVADAELPATPLHVGGLKAVQISGRNQDDEGEHVHALALASHQFDTREAAPRAAADGTYQVVLPDSFWRRVQRDQVRLGLMPVPSGMHLVTLSSHVAPVFGKTAPGAWIDIVLNFRALNATNATVRLLEQVEVFKVQRNDATLDPNGNPQEWIYTVFLTSEQAELVELAKRMQGSDFVLVSGRAPTDATEAIAVDPELRDRLMREGSPEPSPNGAGG